MKKKNKISDKTIETLLPSKERLQELEKEKEVNDFIDGINLSGDNQIDNIMNSLNTEEAKEKEMTKKEKLRDKTQSAYDAQFSGRFTEAEDVGMFYRWKKEIEKNGKTVYKEINNIIRSYLLANEKKEIMREWKHDLFQALRKVSWSALSPYQLQINRRFRSMDIERKYIIHPFLKWAGGKSQIINKLKHYLPNPTTIKEYYEPFFGGGALLFNWTPKKAHINDINEELIITLNCFQNDKSFTKLIELLQTHELNHSKKYYYEIRNMDRDPNYNKLPDYVRAARMIYLNKTCFNGLYRVNSQGYFNVPLGKKQKIKIFDTTNLCNIQNYFANNKVKITMMDFEKATKGAKKDGFIYFNPPYDVLPDKKGFVDYSKDGFGKEEQIRLAEVFKKLDKKGVKLMLSNLNTPFINELYKDFNIHVIEVRRLISSKGDGRGCVEEVIITNY
ncbi:DNA adenine methylase [Mycoplasmopsis adleri]|uniref:DNA adenine methylase n=1 Tax=Mycoplasmopsis adleri TaxID=51362 RepID=UPI0038731D0A